MELDVLLWKSTVSPETTEFSGKLLKKSPPSADCDLFAIEKLLHRTDIVMDVGRSLNPAIDVGQIEGAFVQGYGYMTMEEMLHNKHGEILNKNLSSYKVNSKSLFIESIKTKCRFS